MRNSRHRQERDRRRAATACLLALGTLAAGAACGGGGRDRVAGETAAAAPAGAVDTVADTVTTGAALKSTEQPMKSPADTGARRP